MENKEDEATKCYYIALEFQKNNIGNLRGGKGEIFYLLKLERFDEMLQVEEELSQIDKDYSPSFKGYFKYMDRLYSIN